MNWTTFLFKTLSNTTLLFTISLSYSVFAKDNANNPPYSCTNANQWVTQNQLLKKQIKRKKQKDSSSSFLSGWFDKSEREIKDTQGLAISAFDSLLSEEDPKSIACKDRMFNPNSSYNKCEMLFNFSVWHSVLLQKAQYDSSPIGLAGRDLKSKQYKDDVKNYLKFEKRANSIEKLLTECKQRKEEHGETQVGAFGDSYSPVFNPLQQDDDAFVSSHITN